jgi:hypothetical protein
LPEKCFASRENDELNLFGKLGFSERECKKESIAQGCPNYTFGVFFYTRFEIFKVSFRDKIWYTGLGGQSRPSELFWARIFSGGFKMGL